MYQLPEKIKTLFVQATEKGFSSQDLSASVLGVLSCLERMWDYNGGAYRETMISTMSCFAQEGTLDEWMNNIVFTLQSLNRLADEIDPNLVGAIAKALLNLHSYIKNQSISEEMIRIYCSCFLVLLDETEHLAMT